MFLGRYVSVLQRIQSTRHYRIITVRNGSCIKVMFSQASVCPQRGWCTPTHPLGRHPLWQTSPKADTSWAEPPPPPHRRPLKGGTHPTGMHSCSLFISIPIFTKINVTQIVGCIFLWLTRIKIKL